LDFKNVCNSSKNSNLGNLKLKLHQLAQSQVGFLLDLNCDVILSQFDDCFTSATTFPDFQFFQEEVSFDGSGCRSIDGSLNLKLYSTTSCNVTVTHDEIAVGLVETY